MIAESIKAHRHDGILTQNVYLNQIQDPVFGLAVRKWSSLLNLGETSIARVTNGVAAQNVFFNNSEVAITCPYFVRINAVYVICLDATAGNILVKNGTDTVATIAKGTVAGVMTGATSLAHNIYVPGNGCGIVSDSAGNAVVIMQLEFSDIAF